ncbi:MAG TPA: hypothetical protein VGL03_16255 [Thermoanaerobaculia bacterium]|jgi:hypothetical protein
MGSRVRSTVVVVCAFLWTAAVFPQTVQLGGNTSLTFKGFISATAFAQDQKFAFGNGQNAEWPIPPEAETDRWFGGGDVRNTRLTMVFDGPKVIGDWKVGGTIEMDFFGGFNGTGAFSGQQPNPRLRFAFADFTNGRTTIRAGQFWSPLFGNTAVSLSHLAFPLGYGSAGDIGWRFPGLFVYQTLTPKDSVVNADIQFAVMSGSWNKPDSPGNPLIDYGSAGNATWPQFELRANVGGKAGTGTWSGYVVGHIDEKDLSGAGASASGDKLTGSAVEIGAKFQFGPVMIQGNGYSGRAIGQNFGQISQFGNIFSMGGWAQVGFDIDKNWSLFGFWGIDDPKDKDALAALGTAARLKNEMYVGMVRWKVGQYALGFEYLHAKLTSGPDKVKTKGNQVSLSTLFNF